MPKVALALLLVLTALPVAAAAPQPGPGAGEIGRLQAEFRDERARARSLRAEAADAGARTARLERELASLGSDVTAGDRTIAAQRARLRSLSEREAVLVAQLSRARGRQARLLSALQMMSRRPPPPLLVPADKAVDTVRAAILMKAIAPELQARVRPLADRQAEINRVRRLAALGSEALFTAESAEGDRRAQAEARLARQTRQRSILEAEAGTAERAVLALETRLRALGGRVPAADADAGTATAPSPAGRDRLTPPVETAPSIRFGRNSSGWRWRGDRIEARSPAAGRVIWTGPLRGWGRVIILDLGPGWRAVISGLDEVSVETGARVADGQTLGRSGADGEIGFELRRDERPIDPAPWLAGSG
ncbi:murein hydrolase activator EnvC family protein [Brevundimonas sp.]|uniref:murein hydrolase activator EnvC family protein n=1 Tax=Brevundimonas sp. TaxID=1871086 RepID=UPI002D654036|nr:peptidoglycan DD-metalloendopeptidase family protein [Brevundimonas sp.]HYC97497.1 peptidoglycan DD-metalloendopeptidase family protein [Brevundimonas sp.]